MSILLQFNLAGKTALVTGCNKGIGKGMALTLAEAGADIIGVSSSLQPGSEAENEINALGRSLNPYNADMSKRESLYAFIENVLSRRSLKGLQFSFPVKPAVMCMVLF